MQKAVRKRTINDQVAQALGMAARKGDGNCAALGCADQNKSFETCMIDYCFKVLDQAIEGNLFYFALRKSKAASGKVRLNLEKFVWWSREK
jgi:hypothetical protein